MHIHTFIVCICICVWFYLFVLTYIAYIKTSSFVFLRYSSMGEIMCLCVHMRFLCIFLWLFFSFSFFCLFSSFCFYFTWFFWYYLNVCFLSSKRKGKDLDGRKCRKDLRGVVGGENIIRLYCMKKPVGEGHMLVPSCSALK